MPESLSLKIFYKEKYEKITQNGYYDFKKFFKFLINKFMNS